MTREQDLERELTTWLAEGPGTAPADVLGTALERIEHQRQRHWLAARLRVLVEAGPMDVPAGLRPVRLVVLIVLLAVLPATMVVVSVPIAGGPTTMPTFAPDGALHVTGLSTSWRTADLADAVTVDTELSLGDPRVSGDARLVQHVEDAPSGGMQRAAGWMRVENAGGSWQGEVLEVRYPDGTGLLSGWLSGDGAYAGVSCFIYITTTDAPDREVQVVIWPGEPPTVPDVAP